MKKLANVFAVLGFVIQYIVPIALFGDVVPFVTTKEVIGKCLTGAGYIALGLVLFFVCKKGKEWILQRPKSIFRAFILSIPDILWWLAIHFALDFLAGAIINFSNYWSHILIFILIGRGCYMISEGLSSEEGADK